MTTNSKLIPYQASQHTTFVSLPTILIGLSVITSGCAVTEHHSIVNTEVTDKAITSIIQSHYAANQALTGTNISVETLYGVVLLSGSTQTSQEKTVAHDIAQQTVGVKAIHNDIAIQPPNSRLQNQ